MNDETLVYGTMSYGGEVVIVPEPLAHEIALLTGLVSCSTWGEARDVLRRHLALPDREIFVEIHDDPESKPPPAEHFDEFAAVLDVVASGVLAAEPSRLRIVASVATALAEHEVPGWLQPLGIEDDWLGVVAAMLQDLGDTGPRWWRALDGPTPEQLRAVFAAWQRAGADQRSQLLPSLMRCVQRYCDWHGDDEEFDPERDIPGYGDGDFPPDPRRGMDTWLPEDVVDAYAEEAWSPVSGDWLTIPEQHLRAVLDELARQGIAVREDQELIASLYPGL